LAARHLAGRILNEPLGPGDGAASPVDQIDQLYLITLSRQPDAREKKTLATFLTAQQQRLTGEARDVKQLAMPVPASNDVNPYAAAALVDACLAILNASEFLYVD
jgi:hypothetical protein